MNWAGVAVADLRLVARSTAVRAVTAAYVGLAFAIAAGYPEYRLEAVVLANLALVPALALWLTCGALVRERAHGRTLAALESGVTRTEYLAGKLAGRAVAVAVVASAATLPVVALGAAAGEPPTAAAAGALATVVALGVLFAVAGVGVSASTPSPSLAAGFGAALYLASTALWLLTVLQVGTRGYDVSGETAGGALVPLVGATPGYVAHVLALSRLGYTTQLQSLSTSMSVGPGLIAGVLALWFGLPLAFGVYRFRTADVG